MPLSPPFPSSYAPRTTARRRMRGQSVRPAGCGSPSTPSACSKSWESIAPARPARAPPPDGRRNTPAGGPPWGRGIPSPARSHDSAALNDADDNDDDRDHEEDVNESSHRVGRHHSQKPEHKQDHEDGPKHVLPPGLP